MESLFRIDSYFLHHWPHFGEISNPIKVQREKTAHEEIEGIVHEGMDEIQGGERLQLPCSAD